MHSYFIVLTLFFSEVLSVESQCGDWLAYRDVKCFKILVNSGLQTYDDALNLCQQQSNDSNLITITSSDEQNFLTTLIFITIQVMNNVSLGAKFNDSQYKWLNGLNLTYTDWAEGYPKNLSDNCVQLDSDLGLVGKWIDSSCQRKNIVVCEKLQTWSMSHIQQTVLSLLEKVSILEKNDVNLKQNLLSIGFIYVQFPGEKTPQEMWSWMTWQEITSSFAGLFFRAFGGNSSSFGSTQEANAPRITQIQSENFAAHSTENDTHFSHILEGEWSKWIYTGSPVAGAWIDTRFYESSDEVRPRNTAIRIWKRNA